MSHRAITTVSTAPRSTSALSSSSLTGPKVLATNLLTQGARPCEGQCVMRRKLRRDSPVPVWAQIEEDLAGRIGRGELRCGDRLPPERELAEELDVSRGTVRQALDALAGRGLVERGVGRGTFVAATKVEHRLNDVAGFTDQMARAGL